MSTQSIYLDYAAATPVDSRVAEAMSAILVSSTEFANPSAVQHAPGRVARDVVERAREQVAALINAASDEIVWTSGATEANNLALLGAAKFHRGQGRHIVTAKTEHASVIEAARQLESEGYAVTYLASDEDGVISPSAVAAALRDDTTLVSIMHVNNEIGVVQDIAAIGALCRERDVLFHVDAAQSAGRVPIDVVAQSIDLMSLSAQKIYGPKGAGVLYLNAARARRVKPIMFGGGHERGLRPGTLPTHQLVGMGTAFELARRETEQDVEHTSALRDRLWEQISEVPGVMLNGERAYRSCHILCVSVEGIEGESLMHDLQSCGIAASAGAACVTAGDEPSAVLRSLGRSDELAKSSVRFSVGRWTTADEIDYAANSFIEVVRRLQRVAGPERGAEHVASEDGVLAGMAGSRERGIEVAFAVRLDGSAIKSVDFRAYGCPHTLAACTWLTRRLAGQPVAALRDLAPEELMTAADVPVEKRGRMLVVQDALLNCFAAWDNTRLSQ